MKIIDASYEILNLKGYKTGIDELKHVEKVGRVCYKSENLITDNSFIDFINKLRKRKHYAVFEHAYFSFESFSEKIIEVLQNIPYISKYIIFGSMTKFSNELHKNIFTISLSSIYQLLDLYEMSIYPDIELKMILMYVIKALPFSDDIKSIIFSEYEIMEDLLYVNNDFLEYISDYDVATKFGSDFKINHKFVTVKFICDRGVSHELVRHRVSFAQESTRYCNYSKEKFGNQITVINPHFFENSDNKKEVYDFWKNAMSSAESYYFLLLKSGISPQDARAVLPNSLKTEIMVTMNLHQWNHFFKMRTSSAAHPQMRELAIPLYKDMKKEYSDIIIDLNI